MEINECRIRCFWSGGFVCFVTSRTGARGEGPHRTREHVWNSTSQTKLLHRIGIIRIVLLMELLVVTVSEVWCNIQDHGNGGGEGKLPKPGRTELIKTPKAKRQKEKKKRSYFIGHMEMIIICNVMKWIFICPRGPIGPTSQLTVCLSHFAFVFVGAKDDNGHCSNYYHSSSSPPSPYATLFWLCSLQSDTVRFHPKHNISALLIWSCATTSINL